MTDTASLFARCPMLRACEADLQAALELLVGCYSAGGKLLVCGNGGSAADCEHIVGELMKGFQLPRPISKEDARKLSAAGQLGDQIAARLQGALPAISLVSQTSIVSAVANDTSDEMVFAQQVYGYGRPGDVLLAISTSGNSRNVIAAAVTAKAFGLGTLALTGRAGGRLAAMTDLAIRVPADSVIEIQELHLPTYHWLCVQVEAAFFSR